MCIYIYYACVVWTYSYHSGTSLSTSCVWWLYVHSFWSTSDLGSSRKNMSRITKANHMCLAILVQYPNLANHVIMCIYIYGQRVCEPTNRSETDLDAQLVNSNVLMNHGANPLPKELISWICKQCPVAQCCYHHVSTWLGWLFCDTAAAFCCCARSWGSI